MSNIEEVKSTKIFNYHPWIHKIYWVVFFSLIFSELVIVRLHIFELMKVSFFEAFLKIVALSTVVLTLFFRLVVFVRPRVFSKFHLFNDRIEIYFKKKKKEFLFNQIEKLSFSFLPPRYFGGYTLHLNTGQKFMFLSFLSGSHEILNQILKMRPELSKEKKLKAYSSQSLLVDLSWQRMRLKFKKWPLLLVKLVVTPLVLSLIISLSFDIFKGVSSFEKVMIVFLLYFFLALFLSLFIYHIEENYFLKHYEEKKSDSHNPSLALENEIYFQGTYYILLFMMSVLVYFLL